MRIMGENKMTFDQVMNTKACITVPSREDVVKNDTAKNHQWKPIAHAEFVGTIHDAILETGLEIVDASFALNGNEHLLVGGFKVKGDMLPAMPGGVDAQYELFLRHANDMSAKAKINAGTELMVCTNGCMSGQELAGHKHTALFDVRTWATEVAMKAFIEDCANQVKFIEDMRATDCSDDMARYIIMEADAAGIIPAARMRDIYDEWKNPVFSYDDFPKNTAFKLYGDFTHVAQKCQAPRHIDIVSKASQFIMENCMAARPQEAMLF